jgi:hypothetical protein
MPNLLQHKLFVQKQHYITIKYTKKQQEQKNFQQVMDGYVTSKVVITSLHIEPRSSREQKIQRKRIIWKMTLLVSKMILMKQYWITDQIMYTIVMKLQLLVSTIFKRSLNVFTDGDVKKNITVIPTTSASGKKLPLVAINKSKTDRYKKKMKIPKNIVSFHSNNGWTNTGVMLRYLDEVIKPVLSPKGGALVLDEYPAHFTEPVIDKANQMKLRLIKVPGGETSRLQPLDISVMGPMCRIRQRIYTENKILHPDRKDDIESAIERANKAYEQIDAETIKKGWKQISDLI